MSTSLRERIDSFVAGMLNDHRPRSYRASKVIHDSIWGTSRFYPHELAIIDSPLFQRLRYINQTGLAFFAYPSLNHSRFEHSLGVATVVKRFFRKLREKFLGEGIPYEELSDDPNCGLLAEMRIAALLHDAGHGIFSHLSEDIYRWYPEVEGQLNGLQFSRTKPSEMLSYFIVTSNSFRRFFETHVTPTIKDANLDNIAKLIIGNAEPSRQFSAQIINGALDADKIDYISRDTFYSGISTTIDIDRLFNDITIHKYPNGQSTLVVTGSTSLERLLFSKVLLYTSIYNHQKVKAADCMVEGLVEYVRENPDVSLCGYDFNDPIDFLRITDNDILTSSAADQKDPFVKKTICNLLNRNLLQRCLVLSKETIDNYENSVYELNRVSQTPRLMRQLRELIVDKLPKGLSYNVHEIWVSLPQQPSLREASQTLVMSPLGNDMVILNDLFPLDGWLRAFSDNKWRGHVFAPPDLQVAVHSAAREVFTDYLGIKLNAKSAAYAHVQDEVVT